MGLSGKLFIKILKSFQIANRIQEPKDLEFIAVIRELQHFLEGVFKNVRTSQPKKFEGPLTWKNFVRKTFKMSQQVS